MRAVSIAIPFLLFGLCAATAVRAADPPKGDTAPLSAQQIADRNVAARGGLQAWRGVQALSFAGQMQAGTGDAARAQLFRQRAMREPGAVARPAAGVAGGSAAPGPQQLEFPFSLQMKRPNKSRLEIQVAGKTALQVYDGVNGWKIRPFLNRDDVEPFSPEEAKSEAEKGPFEGPLIDYQAKGTRLELQGVDKIEGRDAYNLKLTARDGRVQHVWVDTGTFLDVRIEGTPRHMDGKMHTAWIYQRDFRAVSGLQVPFVLETAVDGYTDTHKVVLDKVVVNPTLDDSLFAKPKGS